MARYAYDVNTTTRLIDVHKQFSGGLKTVDTDDALGAVFLRDGQNVSLSEFGFIEKRYGTYENFKKQTSGSTLQGYFEFKDYKIFVIDGKFYVDDEVNHRAVEKENEEEWRYPTLPVYPLPAPYRDVNAVSINNVFYIFTGVYPIYAKVVDEELKFYWFSVDAPSYDEIVVTGHNLLEDDYENLYFPETFKDLATPSFDASLEEKVVIEEADFIPKIPFASEDGKIDLKMSYKYDFSTFDYTAPYGDPQQPEAGVVYDKYYKLELDRVEYRNSGAGASTLDYLIFEEDSVTHSNTLDNLAEGEVTPDLATQGFLVNKNILTAEQFDGTSTGSNETYRHIYTIETTDRVPRAGLEPKDVFNLEFFKVIPDPNNPWEPIVFSELHDNPSNLGPADENNVYFVEITPYDSEGTLFTAGKFTLTSSSIDISKESYKFEIPAGLSTSDFVFGYEVHFKHTIVRDVTQGLDFEYSHEDFCRSFSKVFESESFDQFQDHNFLTVSLTNLLSGTYDIRPVYSLKEYNYTGSSFDLQSTTEVTYTFSNIPITAEKLEDFPRKDPDSIGIEYPKFKPIWTCNKVIEHFGKLLVWGSTDMPTAVFYSFPDRPTYFPSKFYLDFTNDEGAAIENVSSYMNILVAQTADRTWGVRGNSGLIDAPSPYVPFTINPTVGTVAYKSVRPVRNHLFFLSKQGIIALKSLYAADEQYNIEFVDRNIRNIVPQDSKAVGIQYDNQYWLNFPNFGITLRWYIDKKAWVKDVFAWGDDFKGVFKWQNVDGKLEFITYPNTLQNDLNPHIYKIGIDYSLPADMGDNVLAKFETSFLNQNYPFHPKNYKEFKYDFTMQNEYNFSRDPIYDNTFSIQTPVSVVSLQSADFNNPLLKNHTYIISFEGVVELDKIQVNGQDVSFEQELDGSYYLDGNTDYTFILPNSFVDGVYDIDLFLEQQQPNFAVRVAVKDVTYDESMIFLSKIISEERNVLNQQLPIGYSEEQEALSINLEDFKDFTLGSSYFGDRVTFVKTIKLSGKGYNTKAYFEDFSRTKWTIESMGITYKMKRPRSD